MDEKSPEYKVCRDRFFRHLLVWAKEEKVGRDAFLHIVDQLGMRDLVRKYASN